MDFPEKMTYTVHCNDVRHLQPSFQLDTYQTPLGSLDVQCPSTPLLIRKNLDMKNC